jgi:hypothetical protein
MRKYSSENHLQAVYFKSKKNANKKKRPWRGLPGMHLAMQVAGAALYVDCRPAFAPGISRFLRRLRGGRAGLGVSGRRPGPR